jgi:hypothetical protein
MQRPNRALAFAIVILSSLTALFAAEPPPPPAPAPAGEAAPAPRKAPPERTYSNTPYVHHIVLLDEDGTPIRPAPPGQPGQEAGGAAAPAAAPGGGASNKPVSLAKTCGKCHSDYDVMQKGWHFNAGAADVANGRPGEPWILTDAYTRTQLPLSYRKWPGTFHPYDVGLNDFNFARLFGRHTPGGGALQTSQDLRFKMSGPLENDCMVCHASDQRYDAAARAEAIGKDQNFKYAPVLAAFLGKVQGTASRLRDNFDPTGPDARRAPKVNYDASRFDDVGNVLLDITRRVPNERCYFCHTNVDVGGGKTSNAGLETRWQHDRDIHLVKGMLCVDCHRNGADHMITRGYEGEYEDRAASAPKVGVDRTIATLSCRGCHYGTNTMAGGRNAAPRPVHHGLPTLHLEKLSCTACHSGPVPEDKTSLVQTAMAHKLGLPRHETVDATPPIVQQPVFIRVNNHGEQVDEDSPDGRIAPHRMLFPSYWGRSSGNTITPILPEVVAAAAGDVLGEKPSDKEFPAMPPLKAEQILQVLEKLAAAKSPAVKPADAVTARGATTAPSSAPAAPQGEVVFVTGGSVYKRSADGKLTSDIHPAAGPYFWAIGHNVRPAQQALGARGCTECHAAGAPIFDGKVELASVIDASPVTATQRAGRIESTGALNAFAATYPLRWILMTIGWACTVILALVLLGWGVRLVSPVGRRG